MVMSETEEFLMLPTGEVRGVEEEECAEFTCVPTPIKVVVQMRPPVVRHPNVQKIMKLNWICPMQKLANARNMLWQILYHLDGTEFKYDTCSHILARDIKNSNWLISVHLICEDDSRRVCRKTITIKDIESAAILVIMPNMKLNSTVSNTPCHN
ncbi:unnamed protein product [Ceratitis capitata]|uniref:(Mediterranean fruit fly) hypothetical protein n=1 Tax=Ceratitis capitata TaxID=7213 RepID=A0A811V3Q5_CERCA|nr:unnamed protein product [Ceratitis capitata]